MAKDTLKAKFNLTLAQLSTLLSTLNTLIIQAEANQIAQPYEGICWTWEYLLRDAGFYGTRDTRWNPAELTVNLVRALHRDWDHPLHRQEDTVFPIKHELRAPMWEGIELEARLSLMRHMRKRLADWHRHTELSAMAKDLRDPGVLGEAYSRPLLKALYDSLSELERHVLSFSLPEPGLGICRNWSHVHFGGDDYQDGWTQPYRVLEVLASYWPESAVPGTKTCSPIKHSSGGKWSGPNRATRLSLIAFMKTRLRALARSHD